MSLSKMTALGSRPLGGGWEPVVHGRIRHDGFRKWNGAGWDYWYPGEHNDHAMADSEKSEQPYHEISQKEILSAFDSLVAESEARRTHIKDEKGAPEPVVDHFWEEMKEADSPADLEHSVFYENPQFTIAGVSHKMSDYTPEQIHASLEERRQQREPFFDEKHTLQDHVRAVHQGFEDRVSSNSLSRSRAEKAIMDSLMVWKHGSREAVRDPDLYSKIEHTSTGPQEWHFVQTKDDYITANHVLQTLAEAPVEGSPVKAFRGISLPEEAFDKLAAGQEFDFGSGSLAYTTDQDSASGEADSHSTRNEGEIPVVFSGELSRGRDLSSLLDQPEDYSEENEFISSGPIKIKEVRDDPDYDARIVEFEEPKESEEKAPASSALQAWQAEGEEELFRSIVVERFLKSVPVEPPGHIFHWRTGPGGAIEEWIKDADGTAHRLRQRQPGQKEVPGYVSQNHLRDYFRDFHISDMGQISELLQDLHEAKDTEDEAVHAETFHQEVDAFGFSKEHAKYMADNPSDYAKKIEGLISEKEDPFSPSAVADRKEWANQPDGWLENLEQRGLFTMADPFYRDNAEFAQEMWDQFGFVVMKPMTDMGAVHDYTFSEKKKARLMEYLSDLNEQVIDLRETVAQHGLGITISPFLSGNNSGEVYGIYDGRKEQRCIHAVSKSAFRKGVFPVTMLHEIVHAIDHSKGSGGYLSEKRSWPDPRALLSGSEKERVALQGEMGALMAGTAREFNNWREYMESYHLDNETGERVRNLTRSREMVARIIEQTLSMALDRSIDQTADSGYWRKDTLRDNADRTLRVAEAMGIKLRPSAKDKITEMLKSLLCVLSRI